MTFRVRYGRWITPRETRTAVVPVRADTGIALIEDHSDSYGVDLATLWGYVYEPQSIVTSPVPGVAGNVYSNEWNSFIADPVGSSNRAIVAGLSGLYKYDPLVRASGDPIPAGKAVGPDTVNQRAYVGATRAGARHYTNTDSVINGQESWSWHVPDVETDALLPPYEDVARPSGVYTVQFEATRGTVVGSTVDLVIPVDFRADTNVSLSRDDDIRVLTTGTLARTATPGPDRSNVITSFDLDDYDFYHVPNDWLADQLWDFGSGPFMATYQPSSVLSGVLDPQRVVTITGVQHAPQCQLVATYRGPRFRYVYHDEIVPTPNLHGDARDSVPGFYTNPGPIGVQ